MKTNTILNFNEAPSTPLDFFNSTWALDLAQVIIHRIIPANPTGFTFNPRVGRCLPLGLNTNPEIFAVSIAGHELRRQDLPNRLELAGWLRARADVLRCEGKFIGGWPFIADYFLDISVLIRGKKRALAFGRANFQHSIFHPATGQSIRIENNYPLIQRPMRTLNTQSSAFAFAK